jgi:hypothetical protein
VLAHVGERKGHVCVPRGEQWLWDKKYFTIGGCFVACDMSDFVMGLGRIENKVQLTR